MYSFRLKYNTAQLTVYPKYKDTLVIEETRRNNLTLGDKELKNELKFNGVDYNNITAQAFDTKFTLEILKDGSLYFTSYFYQKDCRFAQDGIEATKVLYVTPKSDNLYNRLQEIKDTQCQLTKLNVRKNDFFYSKIPLIQLYLCSYDEGDSEVMNYVGGNIYYQSCKSYSALEISNENGLNPNNDPQSVDFLSSAQRTFLNFGGTYAISGEYVSDWFGTLQKTDGLYTITREFVSPNYRYEIKDTNTNVLVWYSEEVQGAGTFDDIKSLEFTNAFNSSLKIYPNDVKHLFVRVLYGRGYTAEMFIGSLNTKEQNTQTFAQNEQYTGIIQDFEANVIFEYTASGEKTNDPTEYQKSLDNKYFVKKESDNDFAYYPVGQQRWDYISIWVRGTQDANDYQYDNRVQMKSTGYFTKDIIKAILLKFNLPLNYSSLFFDSTNNPLTNLSRRYPLITDAQNLNGINPWQNKQATNSKISLQEIFTLFENLFDVYYEVQGSTLRFEHRYFYENGNSYTATHAIGIDLTNKKNTRCEDLMWADLNDDYAYNIENEYKYIEFNSNGGELFKTSKITQDIQTTDLTNTVDLENFIMDIDHINVMSGIEQINGYAFFMCDYNTTITVPYVNATIKNSTFRVQNYYASLPYNVLNFKKYNFYKTTIDIDTQTVTVVGYCRGKIQQITVPFTTFDIDMKKLIETNLGVAFVVKNTVYLEDNYSKLELSHDIN